MLGRETVLRKTMLDECKGEKFFEVLAVFSNAVLKKMLSSRRTKPRDRVVARTLATATTLSPDRQASLLPLAIAHKAALVNVLQKKNEKRQKYAGFQAVLDEKAAAISHKIKQSKATPRTQKFAVPEREAVTIKKQMADNWIGDQMWLEVLLYGDGVQVEDAFLGLDFADVMTLVERGHKLEAAAPQVGLLEHLQLRVQEQQSRLRKWQRFHETLKKEEPRSATQGHEQKEAPRNIVFDDHLKLQLPSSKLPTDQKTGEQPLRVEYHDILADLDAELSTLSQATYNKSAAVPMLRKVASRPDIPHKNSRPDLLRKQSSQSFGEKSTNPVSRLKRQISQLGSARQQRKPPATSPLDSESTLVGQDSNASERRIQEVPKTLSVYVRHTDDVVMTKDDTPGPARVEHQQPAKPSAPVPALFASDPPVLEPPSLRTEDALAEQIISSIGDATPSPAKRKPQPSLLERTRRSMAPQTSISPISESPTLNLPESSDSEPDLPSEPSPRTDYHAASLLERTRLSMAAMSLKPPASNDRKDQRKSRSRESLFPVNQFDTPRTRKSFQALEQERDSGDSTPKEVLFSDDVEYEHVFKSRPRVAHSPIFSPTQENFDSAMSDGAIDGLGPSAYDGDDDGFDEGVTGVDLADVDADEEDEDGFTQTWENSPSRRVAGGARTRGLGR